MFICVCACIPIYNIYMCVYEHIYVYVYVYMCIWIPLGFGLSKITNLDVGVPMGPPFFAQTLTSWGPRSDSRICSS